MNIVKKDNKIELSRKVKEFLLSQFACGEENWNEEKLASEFKVSRTPIRDALYELEKQRVIIRRHKRGIILHKPSLKEIAEIYDVRIALEKLAVARAVRNVTTDDIADLREIVRNMHRAIRKNDITEVNRMDMNFHMKIVEISGNHYIQNIIEQSNLMITAFKIGTQFHNPATPIQEPCHDEIVDALKGRDKKACIQLIQRHLGGAKKVLLRQAMSTRK